MSRLTEILYWQKLVILLNCQKIQELDSLVLSITAVVADNRICETEFIIATTKCLGTLPHNFKIILMDKSEESGGDVIEKFTPLMIRKNFSEKTTVNRHASIRHRVWKA